jgi:Mg2+-importing ATPase
MNEASEAFWSSDVDRLFSQLGSSRLGLSSQEADRRQRGLAERPLHKRGDTSAFWLLLGQFKSPITVILILAALLSFFLRDEVDAIIILSIIVVSAMLGFWQEYAAAGALKKLLSLVTVKATVLRDGREQSLPISAAWKVAVANTCAAQTSSFPKTAAHSRSSIRRWGMN